MEPQGPVLPAWTAAAAVPAVTAAAAVADLDASVPKGEALGFVRRCPNCGSGVSKENEEQCDKMECRCGCKFCFHCGKQYKLSGGAWRAPCRCNIERYGPGHSFPRPPTP